MHTQLFQQSPSSNASKHSKNYHTYTFYTSFISLSSTLTKMYATTTQRPHLIPLASTLVPSPAQIPLPPSDTCTTTSTHWGTPDYMPHPISPNPLETNHH